MTLSGLDQVAIAGVGMVSFMFVLWLVHLRTVDAGIVDFGWAAGLGLTAVFYAFSSPETGARQWLLALLAGLWSFRLAGYLLIDRVVGGEEDGRYLLVSYIKFLSRMGWRTYEVFKRIQVAVLEYRDLWELLTEYPPGRRKSRHKLTQMNLYRKDVKPMFITT